MAQRIHVTAPAHCMNTRRKRSPQNYLYCYFFMTEPSTAAAVAFASSATSSSSSQGVSSSSSWTGWIVPRILPKPTADDPTTDADNTMNEAARSINAITAKRSIDPNQLCPGRGPDFHPFAVQAQKQRTIKQGVDTAGPLPTDAASCIPRVPLTSAMEESSSESTSLDVYLYPPTNSTTAGTAKSRSSPLHVRLDRSSQELVEKTLQRMILSLQKQKSKLQKTKKKNANHKNNEKQKQNKRGGSSTSSTVTVWKFPNNSSSNVHVHDATPTATGTNKEAQWQQWNVTKCTNQQVWSHAITEPVLVEVCLSDSDNDGGSNNSNQTNITHLSFQVDACPPTIVSVETFEDFAARNFCGIPLVVQVQTLFATDVVVDWYVEDELACSNSVSYIPRPTDIGKRISVLITPIRKRPNDDSNQTMVHEGRGYEQAYQFKNPVEELVENTMLRLRQGSIWTNPCRRRDQNSPAATPVEPPPLRVLTYNILADQNAYARTSTNTKQISYYPYVDIQILDKARRMPLILNEILSYQADVICLQEVDESIWRRLLRPVLEEHAGYQGYFSSKSAKGMSEGCAMLWSLHRFESVPPDERKHFGLSDLVMEIANAGNRDVNNDKSIDLERWKSAASIAQVLRDNPELKNVIEQKLGHVVQMVSLPLKKSHESAANTPERILVGNTHLFYHPLGAHIRLMQMYAICRKFEEFENQQSSSRKEAAEAMAYPMILCGDMNSSLRRAAGYLLISRRVQPDHAQIKEHFSTFQWKDRDQNVATVGGPPPTMVGGTLSRNMRVEHSEKDQGGGAGCEEFPTIELPDHFPTFLPGYPTEPTFTHYLDCFVGSLDHIFISQCSEHCPFGLAPLQCAPMPSVEDVTEHVAMPSEKLPSDHISLVADLVFTQHHKG